MIDLDGKYLKLIIRILREQVPECNVLAFGSRVNGRSMKYSDLDLVLIGPGKLDWRRIENLKEILSQSDLPIQVDVLDWYTISDEFRGLIENNHEILQKAG